MARNMRESPLAGKVALVTGGSRGIGAAIAKRLAADGASVAVTYSKGADAAASVVKEIERGGGKAIAIQADAADADAVRNAVERTVTTLGRLDVLVNNAGTGIPAKVEETTLADFDRVFAVNVRGVFVATQAALKHLKTGGRIIMIGSCLGERVFLPGMAPYSATKGAVKMFTQGLARELGARGITVNNVQPGPIDTDLNPASGEWAVSQKAAVPLGSVRTRRRGRGAGRVRRRSGVVLHQRREPDGRRRRQRLTDRRSHELVQGVRYEADNTKHDAGRRHRSLRRH